MVRVLVPVETVSGETRVAATPDTVKRYLAIGCKVAVESGAGQAAGFLDSQYSSSGAQIVPIGDSEAWSTADVLLCVQSPNQNALGKLKKGSVLFGLLSPYANSTLARALEKSSLSAIALELLPRISRAQSADALSSQANIAGYKSVLIAAAALDRYFPMLMTAAGTVQPARVLVLGAGVAGLQAVATARRLGAIVYVSDIRSAVKEQVESLGAKFIDPPSIEEKPSEVGGYAKQASEAFMVAQRKQLSDQLSESDVAICTAQVPGKKAPRLINHEMLNRMRSGSVVVDIAVAQGGNCAETLPGQTTVRNGVKLIGASDLPCSVPNHASSLYARNLLALLQPLIADGVLRLNLEDEMISSSLISHEGSIRFPDLLNNGGSN